MRTSARPSPVRAALLVAAGLVLLVVSVAGLVLHGRSGSIPPPAAVASAAPDTPAPPPHRVPAPSPDEVPAPIEVVPAPPPGPTTVRIPTIGVESGLIDLGLNPDGSLEVPEDPAVAGWYVGRPVPGEPGPSVIAGHVDSLTGGGVFLRLRELEPGDEVEVDRDDGTVATFGVVAVEQYDKDEFPTDRVYGPTDGSELRVITCGGRFDRAVGHYTDNVVVFARLLAPPA